MTNSLSLSLRLLIVQDIVVVSCLPLLAAVRTQIVPDRFISAGDTTTIRDNCS